MHEHPQIELYVSAGTDAENAAIEQMLASVDVDAVVALTLQRAGIAQPVMLTLLVTSDEDIREMNKQYREQNKATDVLSFPLLEKPLVQAPEDQLWPPTEGGEGEATPAFVTPPGSTLNLGDVVISWPTIVRQAAEVGHGPAYELLYLLSHGILHLIGYDDQTEAGYQAMIGIQHTVLATVGIETKG
jgi:probable rRNA maturation factor